MPPLPPTGVFCAFDSLRYEGVALPSGLGLQVLASCFSRGRDGQSAFVQQSTFDNKA